MKIKYFIRLNDEGQKSESVGSGQAAEVAQCGRGGGGGGGGIGFI